MKRRIALFTLLFIGSIGYSLAQGMPHRYDQKTETTITGTVQDVSHPRGPNGMVGTHLELKTDAAAIEVHVGPEAFVTKQGFSFEKGDVITVTGSKQVIQNKEVLIAKEVKKGDKTLTLRNPDGTPKWSRRGAPSS